MKKMNFTTIQTSWRPGANWLRGLIPLFALFAMMLSTQTQAQIGLANQAPNCNNFSPAISKDGNAVVSANDFVTNHTTAQYPLTVTVYNRWGGVLSGWPQVFSTPLSIHTWNVCSLLGERLEFSVKNAKGDCSGGWIDLNKAPGVSFVSSLGSGKYSGDQYSEGKMVIYCGQSDATPAPTPTAACGGRVTGLRQQPDWVMMPENDGCDGVNDTSEIIYRTWEAFDQYGNLATWTDKIIVFKLPLLSADAFVGPKEDTLACELTAIKGAGSVDVHYHAWKQPMGIHDYELPGSQLKGVIYELPKGIVDWAENEAENCGKLSEYWSQVVLKKANGTTFTVGQITNTAINHDGTKGGYYAYLHGTQQGVTHSNHYLNVHFAGQAWYTNPGLDRMEPYLMVLELGDQVLSEDGSFVTVTSNWFYNGHGNPVYWFSGGWPEVCGSEGCVSFCDFMPGAEAKCAIEISVPKLTAADGMGSGECDTICLTEGVHCGITINDQNLETVGSCPSYTGGQWEVIQTCWAKTENECGNENGIGEVIYAGDKKSRFGVYKKTWNLDTLPPIFDHCYVPSEDGIDGIKAAIRAGVQHFTAKNDEERNPTVYSTGSHDCGADVFLPSVDVIDNCSGVNSVKAWVEVPGGQRMVALEKTGERTENDCVITTWSHKKNPIRLNFNGCCGAPIEVHYEASDNCWNMSEWSKFIRIEDNIPPAITADRNVNHTITSEWSCVKAETYDEGSWDNCGVDLRLARRADWLGSIGVCANVGDKKLVTWADIFSYLGLKPDGTVNIDKLTAAFDESKMIEQHYADGLRAIYDNDGESGRKALHGWIYDMAREIAANCSTPDALGNKLNPTNVDNAYNTYLKVYDSHVHNGDDSPGNYCRKWTAKEISYLGGGWVHCVPVDCADACEVVESDLVVFDYCQNFGIGWTNTHVEDSGRASVSKHLEDITVSCESYNVNYKEIVEAAGAFGFDGSNAEGSAEVYAALDAAFGTYVSSHDVDAASTFSYVDVTCGEESETRYKEEVDHDGNVSQKPYTERWTVLNEETVTGANGIYEALCEGNMYQDTWVDLDGCGQGTITRRFFMGGGCVPNGNTIEKWQVITVTSACAMTENMFDKPGQVGSASNPVCLKEDLSQSYMPAVIGELALKEHLVGKLCNSIYIGYDVVRRKVAGNTEGLLQYEVTWTAVDWCCAYDSPDREYTWTQKVMAVVDPSCAVDDGDDGSGSEGGLIRGTIATEKGEPVQKVEMKAVLGTGSPMTTVTSGDGSYSFSMNQGMNVSLIPSKNTGFANGVTTLDLIDIQRHVLQKQSLTSEYQRIAADVNGNGGIDAFDIAELRRLILQPDSYQFTNNTSWRFFDQNTNKEVFEVTNLNGDVNVDWVGVKIGDVNVDGDPARSARSTAGALNLNIADKQLKAGETYRVDVTSDNFVNIMGMQYTMSYLGAMVEVESIEAGALNITNDNFFRYAPGVITASWNEADGMNLSSDAVLFTLVLRAKSAVQLRDAISLNSRVTAKEAYSGNGLMDVSLRFDGEDTGFALYQNTPNPYAGQTTIGFKLPEASAATLSVYDVTGKVLKVIEGQFDQGYNEVKLKGSDLNASGVLYYQLDTKTYTATKKMIVIE